MINDEVYVRVGAVNEFGESDLSDKSGTLQLKKKPDVPINLSEDITYRTRTQTGLVWTDNTRIG